MMNKETVSIFIGNNSSNLYGCVNDAILFYNLNFLYPKYLLINDSVKITNLENIFKLNNNSKNVLIFFSGHGLKGGCFQFKDNILKPSELFILINKYFINPINLYIILDCCFSGGFPQIKNYNKIINTFIFSSCYFNQRSSESIILYNPLFFKDYKPYIINKNNIVIGLFTFNLVKIIINKSLLCIDDWFLLENEVIWKDLETILNQKITIKK